MEHLIFPDVFGRGVKAFFTGKNPGADPDRLSAVAGVGRGRIYMPVQRHTGRVIELGQDLEPRIADAVITRSRGLLIGVQTADCVPLLLHDRTAHAIGAVHAGWRGTAAGILKNVIGAMEKRFSSSPSNISIAIGPSIRGCCYVVGFEVIEAVTRTTGEGEYYSRKGERYFLDLQGANVRQAVSAGVPEKNIWMAEDCTHCLPDKYCSYRFSKGPAGRQGGFIGIF